MNSRRALIHLRRQFGKRYTIALDLSYYMHLYTQGVETAAWTITHRGQKKHSDVSVIGLIELLAEIERRKQCHS